MSTIPKIIKCENDGSLFRFCPKFVGEEREVRQLSITSDVYSWLYEEHEDEKLIRVLTNITAHFAEFVRGEVIYIPDFMKRIINQQKQLSHVWAITPRFNPQYRFFGLFAKPDWFIIFTKQKRDGFGKGNDAAWHREIDAVLEKWAGYFPDDFPLQRDRVNEYITSNVEILK